MMFFLLIASRPLGAFNNYLALHDCQYISVSKDCQQLLKEDEVSSSEEVQHITPQGIFKPTQTLLLFLHLCEPES